MRHCGAVFLVAALFMCLSGIQVEAQKTPPGGYPSNPKSPDHQTPSHPIVDTCEVSPSVRVPCGAPDISAANCAGLSCCFDGQQCFFGNAVTLHCIPDGQFLVVASRGATLPYVDLDSIFLLGDGQRCQAVAHNSQFVIYQFPVSDCGTIVMENEGVIIYENNMVSSYEVGIGQRGAITRDSQYQLLCQCRYGATSVHGLVTEIKGTGQPIEPVTGQGPVIVELRLGNGQCYTKGGSAKDCNDLEVAYTSFYTAVDYPVVKVLRAPVYVEVQLMGKTDPSLVLTLGRCWITEGPNPHTYPQWDLLVNGCPNSGDPYLSTLIPLGPNSGVDFPTHHRRFMFRMFSFVNNDFVHVDKHLYIHCSTSICSPQLGVNCDPVCYRAKREAAIKTNASRPKPVVTVGPLTWIRSEQSD